MVSGQPGPFRIGQPGRDLDARRGDVGKLDGLDQVVGSMQRSAPDRIRRQADRLHFEPRHNADHPLIAREVSVSVPNAPIRPEDSSRDGFDQAVVPADAVEEVVDAEVLVVGVDRLALRLGHPERREAVDARRRSR